MPVTRITDATAPRAAQSNAKTRRAATQTRQLPLAQTSLIGTFLTPSGSSAYLKLPRGELRRVRTGDMLDGARITAIGDGRLTLTRGTESRAMHMAGH